MKREKISKEHLQELLDRFEKDEKVNNALLIYTILVLLIIEGFFFSLESLRVCVVFCIILILIIIVISYSLTKPFSLRFKGKKNKELTHKMESFLVSGKYGDDEKVKIALDKLTLTESHYKINQLLAISYFLFEISVIMLLFGIILPYAEESIALRVYLFIEFFINLILFLFQTLRYMNFKNIRKIREFLYNIIYKELKEVESDIEKLLDLKISELQLKETFKENLQKWSDLYLGSHFIGLRTLMLISDYKSLIYSLDNERYYFNLFNDLKFKLEEVKYYSSEESKNELLKLTDNVLKLVDLNINRLNISIKSRLIIKEEHRAKVRMIQIWITIIGIVISIVFSLLNFLNSI